jgi:peroxiredoxin
VVRIGQPLPDLALLDLDGRPMDLEALRGHRVLITFERSVDW